MFNLKILYLIILTFASVLHASEYSSYEFVPMNQHSLEQINQSLEELNLMPLAANNMGNTSLFGANQIYINSDFSRIVSFKYDVKGNINLNQWEYLNDGIVYHYKENGKINALFFHGVSEEIANKTIEKIKNIKLISSIFNPFKIENLEAADCDHYKQNKIEYPIFEKISSSIIFESLLSCGTGIKSGAYDSTIGVAQMAWHGLESIGSEAQSLWTNPKQKMDQYYQGIVKGSLVVKDLFTFVSDMIINPEKASNVLKAKYGQTADKVIAIFNHIKNLPDSIKIEMSCAILTGVGIDALVAYLSVGAGTGKLALTIKRFSEKFETIGKVFKAMDVIYNKGKGVIALSKEKLELFTRRILQNKIPEEDLEYINSILGKSKNTDETIIEALTCYIK